ncbi:MAG: FAD:protein FMN transferase [Gemmatimonadaceae bacterium]
MSMISASMRQRVSRREFVGLGIGAFVAASIPLSRRQPAGVVQRTIPVMGTIARFAVVHRDAAQAQLAIDAAIDELLHVERVMTRFTDTSDIGRANLFASVDAVTVTPETALVTSESLRWADVLDGRYDPAMGEVIRLWNVKDRHEPPRDERVAELAGRRFHRMVEVGASGGSPVLRFHGDGARLDLGSIAKGFGVDRAVAALRRNGIENALVVAGGDLYALGTAPDGDPWSIGIQSPSDMRELAGTLRLENRAVATSGIYRQFFRHRGHRYHHIMDPATGRPRETEMKSLTIIADRVMHADAATTALYGLGEAEIRQRLARHLPGAQLSLVV